MFVVMCFVNMRIAVVRRGIFQVRWPFKFSGVCSEDRARGDYFRLRCGDGDDFNEVMGGLMV
jgi:hypothetical protein